MVASCNITYVQHHSVELKLSQYAIFMNIFFIIFTDSMFQFLLPMVDGLNSRSVLSDSFKLQTEVIVIWVVERHNSMR